MKTPIRILIDERKKSILFSDTIKRITKKEFIKEELKENRQVIKKFTKAINILRQYESKS